jgi:hypothetical protein
LIGLDHAGCPFLTAGILGMRVKLLTSVE